MRRLLLVALWSSTAVASGLPASVSVALWACDSMRFTDAMVKACTSAYPSMASRFDSAFGAWKERNEVAAVKALAACGAEMERRYPDDKAVPYGYEQLRRERIAEIRDNATEGDCRRLLIELESGKTDLELH